ncbi:hypothetical protein GGR51DRAFT_488477 [Nemania sp. FL0031]|nr:hypothetical protein GGR51DRAFT_488477 [Nemania sp. FL0031]
MAASMSLLFQDTPRHLTLNAARTQWNKIKASKSGFQKFNTASNTVFFQEEESEPAPDFTRLHPFYAPGLVAGTSAPINPIAVTQIVKADENLDDNSPKRLILKSEQQFTVNAHQFALPDGNVHSVYPAQGMTAEASILPHIVLNDLDLPWQRSVASQNAETDPSRDRVPWLALLCFTADELLLTSDELCSTAPKSIFSKKLNQSSTLSLKLQVGDILSLNAEKNVKHCVPSDADPNTAAEFILITPEVFNNYFSLPPINGTPVPQSKPDITMFKYLAHSRAVNTENITYSPAEDDGVVGVIVAPRTGPWNITSPTQIFVHLVSLDRVNTIAPWPTPNEGHVALCSLYSWTYQCLPPGSRGIADTLQGLVMEKSVLSASHLIYEPLLGGKRSTQEKLVGQRLKDGFTMTKYRAQIGEETVGFFRGPLTPTIVPHPLNPAFEQQSTSSTDLQILDRNLGIMDVTYSSAWQLGRTLGLDDRAFCLALGRLRTAIYSEASVVARNPSSGGSQDQKKVLAESLRKSLSALESLAGDTDLSTSATRRWNRSESGDEPKDTSLSAGVRREFSKIVDETALKMAQGRDGEGFYNEMNAPKSADWAVVLKWVLDRMFLVGIPAHYLIIDPSYLPNESFRFFFIDQNWIDAMIDGALSLGNHIDQDNDVVRSAIKKAIAAYLDMEDPVLGYKPQRPKFGFLLRSDIVSQFPDLKIDAPFTPSSAKAPLLRQENIDSTTLFVLFDRLPGSPELGKVTLTQPSHQQHFVAASHVGPDPHPKEGEAAKNVFKVKHKSVFMVKDKSAEGLRKPCGPDVEWWEGTTYENPVFNFSTRMLYMSNYAQHLWQNLKDNMESSKFDSEVANAAMVAIQLSNPVYQVAIDFVTEDRSYFFSTRETESQTTTGLTMRNATKQNELSTPLIDSRVRNTAANITATLPRPSSPLHYRSVLYARPSEEDSLKSLSPEGLAFDGDHSGLSPMTLSGPSPASKPIFEYKIYPVTATYPGGIISKDTEVPTQSGIVQDLVFSIVLPAPQRTVGAFSVKELRVIIPYGSMKMKNRTSLFTSYEGHGPVMLSNLRFNVIATYQKEDEQDFMYLRILPRKVNGAVSITHISEMSILLPEVSINEYTDPGVFVECTIEEYLDIRKAPFRTSVPIFLDTTPKPA